MAEKIINKEGTLEFEAFKDGYWRVFMTFRHPLYSRKSVPGMLSRRIGGLVRTPDNLSWDSFIGYCVSIEDKKTRLENCWINAECDLDDEFRAFQIKDSHLRNFTANLIVGGVNKGITGSINRVVSSGHCEISFEGIIKMSNCEFGGDIRIGQPPGENSATYLSMEDTKIGGFGNVFFTDSLFITDSIISDDFNLSFFAENCEVNDVRIIGTNNWIYNGSELINKLIDDYNTKGPEEEN